MVTVFVLWLLLPGASAGSLTKRTNASVENFLLSELQLQALINRTIKLFSTNASLQCTASTREILAYANQSTYNADNMKDLLLSSIYYCSETDNSSIASLSEIRVTVNHPPKWKTWTLGILATTLINIASLAGYALKPFMKRSFFGYILMWLVGLAVGSMSGSAILHLIPQGYEITDTYKYLEKSLIISTGLYLFYLIDKILKMITVKKKNITTFNLADSNETNCAMFVGSVQTVDVIDQMNVMKTELNNDAYTHDVKMPEEEPIKVARKLSSYASSQNIAPVAWMVVFGDALHNFVDGLAIGAAFTDNVARGFSICIAVAFEEIPNELGDFAVLLNSGLQLNYALLLNFAAACSNYLGLILGITLGELSAIHSWVYCGAGGMFLYISLVVMVNELNHIGDRIVEQNKSSDISVFLIQNSALLCGFTIMAVMGRYGNEINL